MGRSFQITSTQLTNITGFLRFIPPFRRKRSKIVFALNKLKRLL